MIVEYYVDLRPGWHEEKNEKPFLLHCKFERPCPVDWRRVVVKVDLPEVHLPIITARVEAEKGGES